MIKQPIKNRWTDKVKFEADIDSAEYTPLSIKLGMAVKWGVENEADLRMRPT